MAKGRSVRDEMTQHVEVASMAGAPSDVQELLKRIEGLEEKLALSEEKRGDAEKAALAAAEAQGMLQQREIQEVATGKHVEVSRAKGYKVVGYKDDGRDILKPEWEKRKLPTYFYKIDMPPCGGIDMKVNGVSLYHGAVYEFDIDTLRTVKDQMFRLWDHDRNIHGSDENFYRKPRSPSLSARG